jgi:hypothetical protein
MSKSEALIQMLLVTAEQSTRCFGLKRQKAAHAWLIHRLPRAFSILCVVYPMIVALAVVQASSAPSDFEATSFCGLFAPSNSRPGF